MYADGRVLIKTAPVGHNIAGARGHGYSVWAPIPSGVTFSTVNDMYVYLYSYAPSRNTSTTQEWEMADDLGDSNGNSLQQGGKLPANSTAQRTVGRIYAAAGQTVTYKLFPEINGTSQNISVYNTSGIIVSQVTGTSSNSAALTGSYTPASDGWLTLKVKHANATTAAQKVWVNITYTAPTNVNTRTSPGNLRTLNFASENEVTQTQSAVSIFPNPTNSKVYFAFQDLNENEKITLKLYDLQGRQLINETSDKSDVENIFNSKFELLNNGVYFIQIESSLVNEKIKLVKLKN